MRRLALPLALVLLAGSVRAGTELLVPLHSQAQAVIKVSSGFDQLPDSGYAPVDVQITNSAARAGAWTFEFQSPEHSWGRDQVRFSPTLTVPAKATRTYRLAVPLGLFPNEHYSSRLSVSVHGPDTDPGSMVSFPSSGRSGAKTTTRFAKSEAIATGSSNGVEEIIEKTATRFRAADLPEDWRALVGFSAIWLTAEELKELAPAQRGALHDWVVRGGSLSIAGAAETPPAGFGEVNAFSTDEQARAARDRTVEAVQSTLLTNISEKYVRSASPTWSARDLIGAIAVNVPLLIAFMAVFAALAGPVNLFVFAPSGRRHRLFWTTPAISLGASALLFLVIVLQDGFGGSGLRTAMVHLLPGERKQVVLQEQLARTGVLRSSSFTTADPVFIAPIELQEQPHGSRSRTYENADRVFAGGWFASRSLQAHWLETISPTRAEVTLVNATAVRDEQAVPVLLSSIGSALGEFIYFDEHGRAWRATNVRAGEKIALEPVEKAASLLPKTAGPRLRSTWEKLWARRGYFYAVSDDGAGAIETLRAIRWNHQQVLFLGEVSAAPAP